MLRRDRARARGITTWAAIGAVVVIVSGCGGTTLTPTPGGATPSAAQSIANSSQPSVTLLPSATPWPSGQVETYQVLKGQAAAVAPAADQGAAAGARIDSFAFDLFGKLDASGNLCYSPTSIMLALAMVRAGAQGATATQMDAVLHQFGAAGQEAQIAALIQQLNAQILYVDSQGDPLGPTDTPDPASPNPVLQLSVADQVFAQKGMNLKQPYLNALSSTYGAGVAQLDFQNNPESARLTINKWASDNTKGRIPEPLQQGDIQSATRIALANAIYLKASWMEKFDPANTKPAQFTTGSGSKVTVQMMNIESEYRYTAGTGYKAVEVALDPYSDLTMDFIVPDDMKTFQSSLTTAKFNSILSAMSTYIVTFGLPKYSVESRVDLASVLSSMGMPNLFMPGTADLSGITSDEQLFVDKVIHQANMDVDEEGVTAAAVTIVGGLGGAGEPPPHVNFTIDHPFLYFARDRHSGSILFMGRVDDPTTKS